ncbi:MAG: FAD-dependent oxidoreductase [Hyphomicrobiales bacterium]|nr:FAD-dependent oxidoreductase [Hyphomicrobiales bacterium]
MAQPIILAVDDDPEVLAAVERDLRQHYRRDYRIMKASSGRDALAAAQKLKQRGSAVALFLADQRMPEMSGTDFLKEARKLHPDASKVLLTAYADTEAAIVSINEIELDHYLMKPWDPPDQRLYPVLDDLLSDWVARVRLPFDGIRVAGARWSPQSYAVKDFLSRNQIPYQWIDVEQDPSTREMLVSLVGNADQLPIILFPDGSHLVQPTNLELADKIGLQTKAQLPFYDVVIVGAGPAGLAASVYGASEGLRTLLVEQSGPGGQAGTSSRIENYLGFPSGVSGADLARRAAAQAKRLGAELLDAQDVREVRREDPFRVVTLGDGSEISCHALVLATGVSVRVLDVPGAAELAGIGIYYGAAATEVGLYRDCDIAIVGGGNSAGQAALFYARYVKSVTIIIRADDLEKSMSQYLIDRIAAAPNIVLRNRAEIARVNGTDHLEAIVLRDRDSGEEETVEVSALFVFIGAAPFTEIVANLVKRDEKGFVLTGPDLMVNGKLPKSWPLDRDPFLLEASVPGVFAAGDVRAGSSKRVAAAVGEGSGVVGMIHRYLQTV